MDWLKIYVSELEIIGAAILIILFEILCTPVAFELGSFHRRRQMLLIVTGSNAANSDLLPFTYC